MSSNYNSRPLAAEVLVPPPAHWSWLEAVFPGGEQGVGHAAGALLNSMVDLSANPGDAATREVVLARALDVASRFAAAGQQLDGLQQRLREELQSGVAQANRLAANIAELNQRISAAQGLGQPPNDLLDQRDQALSDLSQQLQISTVRADDGSVSVFVAGGQSLVLGTKAQTLKLQPDAGDATRLGVAMASSGVVLPPHALGGWGSWRVRSPVASTASNPWDWTCAIRRAAARRSLPRWWRRRRCRAPAVRR